jgi:hypothetical protein
MAPLSTKFPWASVAAPVSVAIPALLVAGTCGLLIWAWSGPQFDVLILNDHVVGGTGDRVAAMAVGTLSGAVALMALLKCITRIAKWRGARTRRE